MTLVNTQNQKTIFITGSSSGLGRATAKLFASKGWKVIATMRNPEKETELNNISGVTLMALDITNPKQITSVAEKVMANGGVDVVFNNAGYGLSGPLEGLTDEQVMRMVNTNMLGAIRTKSLCPLFQREASRSVYQYNLHWRPDDRPVQLHLPRDQMGARRLE
jgi:NAD(P)-dependent dehydrogenase (short-subunit alcohol dehydrogenase family)